jgi:hypothetical protein
MGATGREHVRENFLMTRLLMDEMSIFNTLAGRMDFQPVSSSLQPSPLIKTPVRKPA